MALRSLYITGDQMAPRKTHGCLNALEARKEALGPSGLRGEEFILSEDVIQPWAVQCSAASLYLGTAFIRSIVCMASFQCIKASVSVSGNVAMETTEP